ncbi:hypothetical protein [Cellulomonas sp. C5510]|uniref:hypothetical protein n=1 Tax=Cellulomonas sp. C5510 TaxID=2871170 RepID=UPI001C97517A|nr:hypothetical protein [Cellulomonas sp. C5510]QZN86225.1 hypothetical protein K5O09_03230 [Cellulomonas sp. C5510]
MAPTEVGLDERQARVWEALAARSPALAGMYASVVLALAEPPRDGCEQARVSLICHGMREIMNGLPEAMATILIPRPSPNSEALKGRLPDLLSKHRELDLSADQDLIPIPRDVALLLDQLIRTSVQEKGRNRSNAAALLTDGSDPNHPLIGQWLRTQRFFLQWAHLDRNPGAERQLPADEVLRDNIRVVEDIVEIRTALFFDNVRALDDLLQAANAEEGGNGE